MDEIMLLRMGERILAVIIGAICIFLGYCLFLRIPEQRKGEANIGLPGGISIFITRVGPGVFFALFGAMIVAISFFKGIYFEDNINSAENTERLSFAGISASNQITEKEARADERAKLRKDIELLNSLPDYLRTDFSPQDRFRVKQTISQIKFELMKPVWGEISEGWGKPEVFDEWRQKGELDPPPAGLEKAVEFFHLGQESKP
ncbi:MAG: hypothetical protein WAW61_19715 [Methylococcaceae bacterium]